MATDRSSYLWDVLSSHKVGKEESLLNKFKEKRDAVKDVLKDRFGDNLYSPFNSGSFAKHTAINLKFDFDLMAPFKHNAFGTLKEMYEAVYDFLYEEFNEEAYVRRQKVSIGIEFFPDNDGEVVKIDVVPGRELNQGQYDKDEKLNLYVYSQFGKFEQGSDYIRSNVHRQVDHIRQTGDVRASVRNIIRLLKVWKKHGNHDSPKSFLIELIVIKAFDKLTIEGGLWDKLRCVLVFIKDSIESISLPDPGNTNNEVADTLTDYEKQNLSSDFAYLIEGIDESSDLIKLYFPINDKFPPENTYGSKADSRSVPPPVKFG
jgi:hypothetical protein